MPRSLLLFCSNSLKEIITHMHGRHAETPECWNIEFELDSICAQDFRLLIKLSANMTKHCLQKSYRAGILD